MKFSEHEIQPLWDEVARIIGEAVIQLRHRSKPLTTETLKEYLEGQLSHSNTTQRVLINAAINMLKPEPRL